MQENIIIRELGHNSQRADCLVETQKDLDDLIDAVNDLHNHNLSPYRKGIELNIKSAYDKQFTIRRSLTALIPNNFSVISFESFKFDAYLKGVEFSGALQFHSVSFGAKIRVLDSRIGSLSFDGIHSSEGCSFGIWDSCEIGELSFFGDYEPGREEVGRFRDFIINDNTLKKVTIGNIQANRVDIERNRIQTTKIRNLDVTDFSCRKVYNLEELQIKDCTFLQTVDLSSIYARSLVLTGVAVKYLSFTNVFGENISLERIQNPSPDTGNSVKFSYLPPSAKTSEYPQYDTELVFSDISDVDRIDIMSVQAPAQQGKPLLLKFQQVRFRKSEDSHYYLGNLKLANLEFKNCMNVSDFLELNNLDVDELRIENTHMGKAMLNAINIRKCLSLRAPVFNDAIFNDVNFENIKHELVLIHASGDQKRDAKTKKDYYRQLKFVMDKNGNFTEANHFFAREMEEYSKTLVHWSDKLIYFTQKAVSDFGNNWQRPLYFLVSLGFTKAILLDVQLPSIEPSSNAIREWYLYAYSLLNNTAQNINPFSGALLNNELTAMSLLYRVVIAYLIYNFIISLKRLARR